MKLWSSIPLNTSHVIDENLPPGQRSLNQLTPRSRQAFLLSTVEEFTRPQVAAIMGVDENEVGALITAAGKEISQQVATDVLIIEDEPLIALDLQAIVLDLGHQTTGIARTHKDAMRLANARRPGLVLADIQLADGSSGLDAVNEMLKSFDVPIIFITAYPERLLTGERPEPAFLITKPFQADTVKATISQALFFDRVSSRSAA
jgi:CheY-like chemotaxis protein